MLQDAERRLRIELCLGEAKLRVVCDLGVTCVLCHQALFSVGASHPVGDRDVAVKASL